MDPAKFADSYNISLGEAKKVINISIGRSWKLWILIIQKLSPNINSKLELLFYVRILMM